MATQQLLRYVILRDGSTLRLRAARPEDLGDIKAFYDGLSPESRYMRFHGFGRTDIAARYVTEAGGVDRVALIGRHRDRVVATAGYDRLREPGVAEVPSWWPTTSRDAGRRRPCWSCSRRSPPRRASTASTRRSWPTTGRCWAFAKERALR